MKDEAATLDRIVQMKTVDPSEYVSMRPAKTLEKYFDDDFASSDEDIHVLVVLPQRTLASPQRINLSVMDYATERSPLASHRDSPSS